MRLSLFSAVATSIFLVSIPLAVAQNLTGAQTQCLVACSVGGIEGTNCTRQDTQCQCASPAYAANITQCGTSNCNFTAAFMQASLASGCASDGFPISSLTASSTGSGGASPTGSSAPNTAQFSVNHVGVAATSAVGLIFYALLV